MFTKFNISEDPNGDRVRVEIPLPELVTRQGLNAQDPLASVHHYLFFMYVILPAAFGVRMCFNCPDCNVD